MHEYHNMIAVSYPWLRDIHPCPLLPLISKQNLTINCVINFWKFPLICSTLLCIYTIIHQFPDCLKIRPIPIPLKSHFISMSQADNGDSQQKFVNCIHWHLIEMYFYKKVGLNIPWNVSKMFWKWWITFYRNVFYTHKINEMIYPEDS